MAIQFLTSINLGGNNELLNARIQNLPSDPGSGAEGQIYFNTTTDKLKIYGGGVWKGISGDITGVTSATTDQLTVANGTGPAPALSIVTGTVADGGTNLVTSDVIFDYVAGIAGGLVDSVTTGNAATITIGGTASDPTVAANTAAVAASGTNLATGDQINTFVTDFGYTTNVGTVTSVASGPGIVITGTGSVAPIVGLKLTGDATAYIKLGADNTALADDYIAFYDDSRTDTSSTTFGEVPMAALTLVKSYVDAANLGQSVFQGGYNAATNTPNLDTTSNIAVTKGFFYAVTDTGTFFTEQVQPGDLIYADADQPANNSGNVVGKWVVVQSGQDIATAGANDGATTKGITGFSSASFSVTSNGFTTIKADGVILGTQTTGSYVEKVTIATDGLLGAVDAESATANLSLDLGAIQAGDGTEFVMSDSGTGSDAYLTPIATAAGLINAKSTFAATITATGTVTHSLGTKDVIVQLYDIVTFDTVFADVDRTSDSVVTITFGATPTNSIRVLVQKVG